MARPLRIEFEGAFYHVMARGNARQDIFLFMATNFGASLGGGIGTPYIKLGDAISKNGGPGEIGGIDLSYSMISGTSTVTDQRRIECCE